MKHIEDEYMWNSNDIPAHTYICGNCGSKVTSSEGIELLLRPGFFKDTIPDSEFGVYICSNCGVPTAIFPDDNEVIQMPGVNFGDTISNLPYDVNAIYEEARSSFSVGSFTGVILLCRTLLDHLAVDLGAKPNQSFQAYIDFLKKNNYVTGPSSVWADAIRKLGNKATHRLVINTKKQAELILKFCEMILKSNYEYPELYKDMTAIDDSETSD